VADFSDDEEDFSSNDEGEAEGSDSEPMPEDAMGRRARKASRAKIPANARVRFFLYFTVPFFKLTFSHQKQKSLFPFQCANAEVMMHSC
jgi:hypothetical protein